MCPSIFVAGDDIAHDHIFYGHARQWRSQARKHSVELHRLRSQLETDPKRMLHDATSNIASHRYSQYNKDLRAKRTSFLLGHWVPKWTPETRFLHSGSAPEVWIVCKCLRI